jgi:hypothetical protein
VILLALIIGAWRAKRKNGDMVEVQPTEIRGLVDEEKK